MPLMKRASRQAGKAATRARILDAALDLFAHQGFERTTVRQIAAGADLTDAALYYYFESKDEILCCLFRERWRDHEVWHSQPLKPGESMSEEVIERLVDRTLQGIRLNQQMMRLVAQRCLAGDAAAIELRNQRMARWRAMALAQFDDRFCRQDAELLVQALEALLIHTGFWMQVQAPRAIAARVEDLAFRQQLYALAHRAVPLERFLQQYEATA